LLGMEGRDVSCGNIGDDGGDAVVGRRGAGINNDVEAASDVRLGVRASNMLDFGGIGLNCEKSETGHESMNSEKVGNKMETDLAKVQRGEDLLAGWPRSWRDIQKTLK
jgi:hypothetical protein